MYGKRARTRIRVRTLLPFSFLPADQFVHSLPRRRRGRTNNTQFSHPRQQPNLHRERSARLVSARWIPGADDRRTQRMTNPGAALQHYVRVNCYIGCAI